MHTVFRIDDINKINKNDSLYQVDLQVTADDDQQLYTLTECIRQEVEGETGWERLSGLLIKVSQFDKAEELFNVLLEQTSGEGDKARYYHQLGYIEDYQGDYKKAIEYYEEALEIEEKTLPPNHLDLAILYNNIGLVFDSMREYSKALSYLERALDIKQRSLPPNHPSIQNVLDWIEIVKKNL